MQPRQVRADEVDAVREIAAAHGTLADWPERPDYLDHQLAAGTVLVCDGGDGRIAGFGATIERDGVLHLCDLFVRPGMEGRGIGGDLLRRLMPTNGRRSTFCSSDRRALRLYAGRGLVPVAPLLYLERTSPATNPAATPTPPPAADWARAVDLEAALRGHRREPEHSFLRSLPGVELLASERAFAYLRTAGGCTCVGPSGGLDAGDAAAVVMAAVTAAAARSSRALLALPGHHPALADLLASGFRISDMDTIMTSPAQLHDWSRIVPDPNFG